MKKRAIVHTGWDIEVHVDDDLAERIAAGDDSITLSELLGLSTCNAFSQTGAWLIDFKPELVS